MEVSDNQPTYVGEFLHNLDVKKRVSVPSCWRVKDDNLKEHNFYLAWPHPNGWINVYPPQKQKELFAKTNEIREGNIRGQMILRSIFSKAVKFSCDSLGRINIPEKLLQHAEINKEVTLVGTGKAFQIWSTEKYAKSETEKELNIVDALGELDI